ncbi:hypothetical protein GCM10009661_73060 [Catellatospora chokoriensis]|uniref:Uncharacterized protein n=2 Tax=Catellatospora chokoriensis TaxID=310353 RepID=A0A8J3JWF8_9ACTN|nr:hypothetical protein Cch02nite_57750 [Catellatospora chokoriensis]
MVDARPLRSPMAALGLSVTTRMSARVAGLAVLAAETTAIATRTNRPLTQVVCAVLVVLQLAAVLWATDRRSAGALRAVAPAGLAAVTATAMWTVLALAAPSTATGNAAALCVVTGVGIVVAALSHRSGRESSLRLALIASAGSALLIFLSISWFLPTVPGFVSHNHPPTYTDAVRMVDPVIELACFVLLITVLGVHVLRARFRNRRAGRHGQTLAHVPGINEMVVEPTA